MAQANNHLLDAAAPVLEPLAGLPRVETAAPDVGRRCVGVVPHAAQSRAPLHAAVQQRQAATQLMALRMIHDQLCSRGPHPQYASRRFSASRRTTTFVRRTATSVRVGFIIRAAVRPWTATDSYAAYGHIPCALPAAWCCGRTGKFQEKPAAALRCYRGAAVQQRDVGQCVGEHIRTPTCGVGLWSYRHSCTCATGQSAASACAMMPSKCSAARPCVLRPARMYCLVEERLFSGRQHEAPMP